MQISAHPNRISGYSKDYKTNWMQLKDGLTIRNRGLLMIKKIFKAIKNILFPKIYMPWEDPINGSNLTHDERVEMIALIDNILADLDEEG